MIEFKINKNDSGQKAEKFLFKATTAPSSLIYKTFRKKDVKINGRWIKEGYLLQEGELLSIYISDEFLRKTKTSSAPMPEIVYEDENIAVMYKPAGLKSQPDKTREDALSERFRSWLISGGVFDPYAENSFSPALCNRLDRNTDGLVIGAKNAAAMREMNQAIKERKIRKFYRCETEGIPSPPEATLNSTIFKDKAANKSYIGKDGKAVSLSYRTISSEKGRAKLEIELHTGRSHQIRAQLSSIGCPIVGDKKYGASSGGGQKLTAFKIIFMTDGKLLSYLKGKTIELP